MYSDDLGDLDAAVLTEITTIEEIAGSCFSGRLVPWDMMDTELPSILFNTAGYLGVFNMSRRRGRRIYVPMPEVLEEARVVCEIWATPCPQAGYLQDVWSGETVRLHDGQGIELGPLPPYGSRLYRLRP
jgi:hypothetical protein